MTVRSIEPFRLFIEMRTFASRKETKRHEEIALLGDMADRNHRLRESKKRGGAGGSREAGAGISRTRLCLYWNRRRRKPRPIRTATACATCCFEPRR